MDTNKLKKFAQEARVQLIAQVGAKMGLVLAEGSAARREASAAVEMLEREIRASSSQQVIEKVAYTWFNRFTALRFMDANGYTNPRVVTPAEGQTLPEILADAKSATFDEAIREPIRKAVTALLDGRTPSRDGQGEAYRLLLVAICNHWHVHMPFMFEKIADYTELLMPEDLLSSDSILSHMRAVMTEEDCRDVEIIGWLYQFYISEKKDQIFAALKKNVKITAENIPAATQLFTPHWIVRYLVENSLGRLWLLNRPQSKLAAQMDYYIAPEEAETDFLRITKPEEIRICDPACGSGHMLTYAFDLLYAIYDEEGYQAEKIPALILQHNLTGVEIDDRAGALAAFALAMKAAEKLGRRRFLQIEVKPDICVLQDLTFTSAEIQDVAAVVGRDMFTDELCETLLQFEQAKNFGSLIVPKLHNPAEKLRVVEARDFDDDLLLRDVQERVLKVLEMAEALSPKYHVVVANPPYMGGKGMNENLGDFAKANYSDSKSDLFAMFMERALSLSLSYGMMATINMQAWMFLSSFEALRRKLLSRSSILSMAHLGGHAFDTIGGAVVSTTAFILKSNFMNGFRSDFIRLVDGPNETQKSMLMRDAASDARHPLRFRLRNEDLGRIPGSPISYWISEPGAEAFASSPSLAQSLEKRLGLCTGNNERFLRYWHEVSSFLIGRGFLNSEDFLSSGKRYAPHNKGGESVRWCGNQDLVIKFDRASFEELSKSCNKLASRSRYFQECISWSEIGHNFAVRFYPSGFVFNIKGPSIFGEEIELMVALGYLNSKVFKYFLSFISQSMSFNGGDIEKVPFKRLNSKPLEDCERNARNLLAAGTWIEKSDESSWNFTTLPLLAPEYQAETLAASYTRLRVDWRGMTDEMQRLEEENNRIFIDAYGLTDELTPQVPLEEITLTCNPAYRYGGKATEEELEARLLSDTIAEFLHYAVGCMFGRYSLDAPGLILANQGEGLADFLARVPEPSFEVDTDNVIPVVDGDWFADDLAARFRKFLRVTFGESNFQENLSFIETALGKDVGKWFTRDFFEYHVRRYKKRPIYWMFSSPKGTFNALIYMHRYRPDTVSVVLNDYLREFISRLQAERARLDKLADDPAASQAQRTKALKDIAVLIKQIDELTHWERDVVFPLAQAKIEIDLDDGVKANYPKFGAALKAIKGLDGKEDE